MTPEKLLLDINGDGTVKDIYYLKIIIIIIPFKLIIYY